MAMKLSEEQIKAATQARIVQALAKVQLAQDDLGRACEMLSPLEHAAPIYRKAQQLYDKVHSFWYVVEGLKHNPKVRLDRTNIEAIERDAASRIHST